MSSTRSLPAAACVYAGTVLAALAFDVAAAEKTESPKIAFIRGDVAKALKECPKGKVKIELSRGVAQLYDAKCGGRVGAALTHDHRHTATSTGWLTCWAFSPDGRFVATGSRVTVDEGGSVGQVCVWDVATGKQLAAHPSSSDAKGQIGNVTGVAFGEDGKTVLFEARKYELSGK